MRLLLLALLFTQVFSQVQMSDIKDLTNNQLDILKKKYKTMPQHLQVIRIKIMQKALAHKKCN